ncbi:MAG TPA: hypothetical protein VMT55_01195, partial [Candidatus Sulfotelmatobacter sp.]|nr:hypothetical protein [Candidatus Sulfotelmatobacter sp.]
MKKVLILTLITVLALSVAAFAAPKKGAMTAVAAAPAPVQSVNNGDAWAGKMAVGSIGGVPSFIYHFNKDVMGAIGGTYFTATGGSQTTIQGKADYVLSTMGSVQTLIGGYLNTVSAPGGNSTTFGGTWGLRTLVQQNLSLGLDIIVLNSTSAGGASVT